MIDFSRRSEPRPEAAFTFASVALTPYFLAGAGLRHVVPVTQLRRAHLELQALNVRPSGPARRWRSSWPVPGRT
ncbi:hypothetical protein LAJ19_16800 (plasmid) [Deinococcus taeanensis]|uniref:hypothetical protein n=1 Tax=Deinococcus taeanensis TaxID=2737050 RepID=UPI001CDCCCF2|nr:hypothetical protein [Deinococcus taeanensis]UBV44446.1 hypothetical protein LAJ19_16800 [Deinococcus taeanensis]